MQKIAKELEEERLRLIDEEKKFMEKIRAIRNKEHIEPVI
jgi:hypothetical protein